MDESRLARVRENLARRTVDQMLVVDPLSIWWLTAATTPSPTSASSRSIVPAAGDADALLANRLFPDASGNAARAWSRSPTPTTPFPLVASGRAMRRPSARGGQGARRPLARARSWRPGPPSALRRSPPTRWTMRAPDQGRPRARAHARRLARERRGDGSGWWSRCGPARRSAEIAEGLLGDVPPPWARRTIPSPPS